MISMTRVGGGFFLKALVLALGAWAGSGPSAMADGGGSAGMGQPCLVGSGCGGPGPYPGFQGFGLGYHLGYGYGGGALGVGPDGGYPFYGGPGYPCCEPRLRRLGGITPFPYFGGPGYPTPDHPNFFGGVGPLVADKPVVTTATDRDHPGPGGDYGPFTGVLPYPATTFAPFATTSEAGGSSAGRTRRAPGMGQ